MRSVLKVILTMCLVSVGGASAGVDPANQTGALNQMQDMPLAFTANRGQWPDSILYRADAGSATMWFARGGVYYQFTRRVERADRGQSPRGVHNPADRDALVIDAAAGSIETILIKAAFVGSNPMVEVVGEGLLDYKCNYCFGNDPTEWRTDVPNYRAIVYQDVYPGIDLRFHSESQGLAQHEFVASPGTDLSQIKIAYEGNVETSLNAEGQLMVTTVWGTSLEAIESLDCGVRTASPPLSVSSDGSRGIRNDDQTGVHTQLRGVTLDYSTFLGGPGADEGDGIAVDGGGCAYVTGFTVSSEFPTLNAYDASYNGNMDIFVTKFSAAGNSLVYSTFLGGSGDERSYGIAVDGDGCAYVTGYTQSADFPTQNAYDASYNGSDFYRDGFVTKFSAEGNALVYSTFLGGTDNDGGYGLAVDGSGCAYVVGYTFSFDFPTQNAYDASYNGNGAADVFVTKFSEVGNSLVYSTFLGGSVGETGQGIDIDGSGCAYVTGTTLSYNFPTRNPYHAALGGFMDAFVTKFSAAGNLLVYSTFLGGSGYDYGLGIAVDSFGRAYVTGYTESSDFPTQNAFDADYGGSDDAYVTELAAEGNALVYSTFLGGSDWDYGTGIAVDASGCAYVAGYTRSSDFPTDNAFDGSYNGGDDVFATKLSEAGDSLVYSTFLGGSQYEEGYGIAVDDSGCAYVTGQTGSYDFPTQNAYDEDDNSGGDVFVTKLSSAISCCVIRGDVDRDGVGPNIADLVYLVTYMFGDGPEPPCMDESDIDGNGVGPDIADLVYLVTYMFGSGPAPVGCQ